jgi:hypothetical protein
MKEYMPDGRIFPCTMGKDVGWTLEHCLATQKWNLIADWIRFFNANYPAGILTEYVMPADKDGKPLIHREKILFEGDLPEDAHWIVEDGGNGEQCIWFCRAIYRLMKALDVK